MCHSASKIRTSRCFYFHSRPNDDTVILTSRCDILYLVWKRRNKLTRANGKESKNECIDIRTRQTCASEMQRSHLGGKSDAYGTGNGGFGMG